MTKEKPSIIISILNWNNAEKTLDCIDSLENTIAKTNARIKLLVIDNGSSHDDYYKLKKRLPNSRLIRLENNIGFAAGHNISIKEAILNNDDYVWVLNNDSIIEQNPIPEMIRIMESDSKCGAISPVILENKLNKKNIDFLASYHDWRKLKSIRIKEYQLAERAEKEQPHNMWVAGTAPLYRVSALSQTGGFDEKFFAYYEDNDLGVRLSIAGWSSRIAYKTSIFHGAHENITIDRPPYYFYLMTRNSFLFWIKHTKLLKKPLNIMKLTARALWTARELNDLGLSLKRDACLNGLIDGLQMHGGKPRLENIVSKNLIKAATNFPYRLYKLFDGK